MQDPLGFWRLNATLAVRMKKLMSGVSKSKPPGCPPEVSQYAFFILFFQLFFCVQMACFRPSLSIQCFAFVCLFLVSTLT